MHSHTHNKHKKPTLPSGSSTPASSPSHCPGGSSAFRTVWSFPVYCLDFVCLWICVCACACECACEAYESKRSKWHNLSSLSRSTHKHTSTHIKKCPTPPKNTHPPSVMAARYTSKRSLRPTRSDAADAADDVTTPCPFPFSSPFLLVLPPGVEAAEALAAALAALDCCCLDAKAKAAEAERKRCAVRSRSGVPLFCNFVWCLGRLGVVVTRGVRPSVHQLTYIHSSIYPTVVVENARTHIPQHPPQKTPSPRAR